MRMEGGFALLYIKIFEVLVIKIGPNVGFVRHFLLQVTKLLQTILSSNENVSILYK